jgi:YD repeat-containing protein
MKLNSILVGTLIVLGTLPASAEKYTYDADGRLTSVTFADSVQIAYTYDADGNITFIGTGKGLVSVEEDKGTVPDRFALAQNYPNPFNPVTQINYTVGVVRGQGSVVSGQLPVASTVRLSVYDILGREVTVLVNEPQAPGKYRVQFDGARIASGVYFYRLQAGDFTAIRKLILLR